MCCEQIGGTWPDDRRDDPDLMHRARFHEWLQSKVATQLAQVRATGVTLIGDLAVGFSPLGADSYEYRDLLALGMRIGAPPDEFNPGGQSWGIPPFVPWRLRAALYQPFIDTVRAALRGMDGLRIDHVMGLFRQYWVPEGGEPGDGAYVRFPADELLAIIAIESTRARCVRRRRRPRHRRSRGASRDGGHRHRRHEGAVVRGRSAVEVARACAGHCHDARPADAGDGLRPFESRRPDGAATVGGGRPTSGQAADVHEAIAATHTALLASPAALRLMTTDDLAGATRQPNVPGLNDEPNWRIRLPIAVSELLAGDRHAPPGPVPA